MMLNVNSFRHNAIMNSDSYKPSHFKQYKPGTTTVYSYYESRGAKGYTEAMFIGLQAMLKEYFEGVRITHEMIDYAEARVNAHLMRNDAFNREGWEHIVNHHGGKLPLRIRAVKEGTVIPLHNVMMTVENTDPKCYWLTNYVETVLCELWNPITIGTNSREIRKTIQHYWQKTSDAPVETLDFKVHDFGFRGVSSVETAASAGVAHLVSFKGTDTMVALELAYHYYHEEMAGYSIPATEHSTITSWGKEDEYEAFRNMLQQFPTGGIACVSDSFDIDKATRYGWGEELKDAILERDGFLVVRPDSGDPVYTTLRVVENLWNAFGGSINSKGYRVLDDHIRMIQGDGIDHAMIEKILANFEAHGYSIDNIAFGSGGGLLQKFNRDTLNLAFKCSHTICNGEEVDVRKRPMEWDANGNYEQSFKVSKAGRLGLVYDPVNGYRTVSEEEAGDDNLLELVFENGEILRDQTFAEIRELAALPVEEYA